MQHKELPLRFDSATEYINGYDHLVFQFLDERVRPEDQERAITELREEPVIFANMIKNNNEITPQDRKDEATKLVATPGNVTVMIGAKRHGKTATVFWIIETLMSMGIKIFWYGYSEAIERGYPNVIQTFDLKTVEGGVLVVDETAIFSSGKDSVTTEQKDRMAQIFTCGHSDYSIVYLSQTFSIDPTILRTMDILWFKPFFQMDFDRETAKNKFSDTYEYMKPFYKDENLVIDCQENNSWFFCNDLPKVWNNELSKPFSRIHDRKIAVKFMKMLAKAGMKPREMRTWMLQRGWEPEDLMGDLAEEMKIEGKRNELKDIGLDIPVCPECGCIRTESKGFRDGKKRLKCLDCGKSSYEEKFRMTMK